MKVLPGTTREILQALSIAWTLVIHCSSGDTSITVTILREVNVTDHWLRAPLMLGDSQQTDMGPVASRLPSDQPNPVHRNDVRSILGTATGGANASFGEGKISTGPDADQSASIISQYSKCDPKKQAMLISMCPATAEEVDKAMCQSDEAPPTVDTIFPVTDSVSGYHFRNFYCWRCFNQSGEPLTWSGELFFTFQSTPDNYSSLSSYLRFIDNNPALTTWEPPDPFSYPECRDADFFNCTVCIPKETEVNGCSLLGRPQRRSPVVMTHTCYACTSYEAKNSLENVHLCENIHPEEVTYIGDWLNFFFLSWRRSNVLMFEPKPDQIISDLDWISRECLVDLGTCAVTACKDKTLLIKDGECDPRFDWVVHRLLLCQFLAGADGCSQRRSQTFLNKQFRNVETQPVSMLNPFSPLDIYVDETCDTFHQKCRCNKFDGIEVNSSESATLKDIISDPIHQLILVYEQLDGYTNLHVNITEKNDFDTMEIETSGWHIMIDVSGRVTIDDQLVSIIIQIMKAVCMEGNYVLCQSIRTGTHEEDPMHCIVLTISPCDIQTDSSQDKQILASDALRAKASGIISGLAVTLTQLMLR